MYNRNQWEKKYDNKQDFQSSYSAFFLDFCSGYGIYVF